jgi:transposase InsO family protein
MQVHARASLSPIGRRKVIDRVVIERWSVTAAAEAAGVTERTVYRWLARFRLFGAEGLVDRRSTPGSIPHKTSTERAAVICELRQLRLTAAEIAERLGMALSTVSAVLLREGLGKRSRLEPPQPANRYERAAPGEIVHIDVKKLGRIVGGPGKRITGVSRIPSPRRRDGDGVDRKRIGWEAVHVAIDDFTRLAYVEVLPNEQAPTAIAFLRRAVAFFAGHGITVQRVMTDNGPAYLSGPHRLACQQLGIRHLRTRPYRPRTNGKAERFIQTLLRRWAYARAYNSSAQRTAALAAWLHHYNFIRPHGSLSHQPPASRLLTKAPRNYS